MAEIKKVYKNWTAYDVLNSDTVGSALTAGTWISISSNTISNTWVTSVNSITWAVTLKTVNNNALDGTGNIAVQATISDLSTIRTNATNWATVVSGDSGVTYTIKVSNSDPASWTASNIITLVP